MPRCPWSCVVSLHTLKGSLAAVKICAHVGEQQGLIIQTQDKPCQSVCNFLMSSKPLQVASELGKCGRALSPVGGNLLLLSLLPWVWMCCSACSDNFSEFAANLVCHWGTDCRWRRSLPPLARGHKTLVFPIFRVFSHHCDDCRCSFCVWTTPSSLLPSSWSTYTWPWAEFLSPFCGLCSSPGSCIGVSSTNWMDAWPFLIRNQWKTKGQSTIWSGIADIWKRYRWLKRSKKKLFLTEY